jgi:transcriptional regulator of arginine metabolism
VTAKFERQGAILRLVQERELATQQEVAEALRSEGYPAVQTTISRDIAQLGLIKVRSETGRLMYALPGSEDLDRLNELATALRRWALSAEPSGPLLVLKTPAGFATVLADVIDTCSTEVAGTIAGENTIFVAPRDSMTGTELAEHFRHLLEHVD